MVDLLGDWIDDAECKGYTHLFFGDYSERPQAKERREQKAMMLCSKCPVIDKCREFARQNMEHGFWGGENEEQRYLAGFGIPKNSGSQFNRRFKKILSVQSD